MEEFGSTMPERMMRQTRCFLLMPLAVVTAALPAACGDPPNFDCVQNPSAGGYPSMYYDSIAQAAESLPVDSGLTGYQEGAWDAIDAHIPGGWAGAYDTLVPGSNRNRLALLFADTTQVSAALDSLRRYAGLAGFTAPSTRDSIVLRQVRWTWTQLYDWRNYLQIQVTAPRTVYGIEINNNVIEFGVASASDVEPTLQQLSALQVPCGLVVVDVAGVGTFN